MTHETTTSAAEAQVAPQPAPDGPALETQGWRYTPHAIVFISSACIMIVELVAGRLIARHLGSSLYTWTSIIGVVLAGMSIGNYLGGRMSDRHRPEAILGWLFLYASMACLLSLGLNSYFSEARPLKGMHWGVQVLLSVVIIFTLPALILGMISPVTAKMALDRNREVGRTIGSVYAWGTAGSIVGTLASGFYLIAALGSKGVVLAVALGLSLIGLGFGPRRWLHAMWTAVILIFIFLAATSQHDYKAFALRLGLQDAQIDFVKNEDGTYRLTWHDYLYAKDSNYQFVKVYSTTNNDGRALRVLCLDYLIHGYIDPDDPEFLEYHYEHIYRDVTVHCMDDRHAVRAFFLGGGSYTFPRWVQFTYPGSDCDVAEIDPVVLEANHAALGLPRDTPIRTVLLDARQAVYDIPDGSQYDLFYGDAFNDLSAPWHLSTLEFTLELKKHLRDDGVYLVNVIDNWKYAYLLGAYVNTLKHCFKHVWVFTTYLDGVEESQETFVVVASDKAYDFSHWHKGHPLDFTGSVFDEKDMAELERKSGGRVLTDDNAPVELLMEPVVREREFED